MIDQAYLDRSVFHIHPFCFLGSKVLRRFKRITCFLSFDRYGSRVCWRKWIPVYAIDLRFGVTTRVSISSLFRKIASANPDKFVSQVSHVTAKRQIFAEQRNAPFSPTLKIKTVPSFRVTGHCPPTRTSGSTAIIFGS